MAPATMKRTDTRVAALRQVKDRIIFYNPGTGEYYLRDAQGAEAMLIGSRRRVFAELRQASIIQEEQVTGLTDRWLVTFTEDGLVVAGEWKV